MAEVKDVVGEYPLSRDFVDFNRLNLQHYLLKTMFGYSLHPKIPLDQSSLCVADVGTGTGVWLLDLASHLDTSAELVGLDVDITQVGPSEWLPPNMKLREWNVFTDPPDYLTGKFDIVHLRLFSFVIEDDPSLMLRRLTKLLKPGGYLQWCEVDVSSMRIVSSTTEVCINNLLELWNETSPSGTRMLNSWAKALPDMFENERLLGVEVDWQEGKRHTSIALHWCNLHIYDMIGARLNTSNPQKALEISRIVQKAALELGRSL